MSGNSIARRLEASCRPHRTGGPHGFDRIAAVYRPGTILDSRQLLAPASAALVVDYKRDDPISGTWFSRDLHYVDLTLSRRPKGALGSFPITGDAPRPVGPILFAPAGYQYAGQGGTGRQKSLVILIEPGVLLEDEIDDTIASGLSHCLALDGDSLRGLLARIEREVATPGFASALLLDGLCLSLLIEMARALRTATDRPFRKGGLSARNLRMIEERVRQDGAAPTLPELAALCAMSPRHLVRTFHAETGGTVGAYVQQVRLDRAKHLLASGTLTVGAIARRAGFATPAAFSNAFRRMTGRSPSDYRAGCR